MTPENRADSLGAACSATAPRVTVIVPAFNAATTLAEALQSIVGQTFQDWEALVVDDRSADRTRAIAQGFVDRDRRFRVLEGRGEGAAQARNSGLAEAGGAWILFLDADDWIADTHLETLLTSLDGQADAVAAYCGSERVRADGRYMPNTTNGSLVTRAFETLQRTCHVCIHAVLVSRHVVNEVGGFDPNLKTCEDWDLWQRIARLGRRWVHVDEVLSYYRHSDGSLSRDYERVVLDAETVIRRGFGADDRVPATHPAVTGLHEDPEGAAADRAVAEVALWYASLAAVEGRRSEAAMASLARVTESCAAEARAMAETMLQAAAYAIFVSPRHLAACWQDYGPGMTRLIEDIGAACSDPVLARRLRYCLDRAILEHDHALEAPRTLGLTQGRRLNLQPFERIEAPAGIDRLHLRIVHGPWRGLFADIGVLGPLCRRRQVAMFLDYYPAGDVHLTSPRSWRRPAVRGLLRSFRGIERQLRRRRLATPRPDGHSHDGKLRQLTQEIDAAAAPGRAPIAQASKRGVDWTRAYSGGAATNIWDEVFKDEDPWDYGSAYEQEKYRRQIELLPEGRIIRGLELACAEGRFTEKLAPLVETLIASDISPVALNRARERCVDFGNIEFRTLDLIADPLPNDLDLIVCSEVLYFLYDVDLLRRTAARIAAALRPGGAVVLAHYFVLRDGPARTGFDWGNQFGAATISEVFAGTADLVLERTILTDVYRIDRFSRTDGTVAPPPVIETRAIEAPIHSEVARHIIWGGAVTTRAEAGSEARTGAPVLMYHRIAKDGPDALAQYRVAPAVFREQMRWLRRHGFHSLTSGELAWFIKKRHPIPGRPVLLSFDDGFQDFADVAWPLVRENDFGAEVFVVTDLAGGTSSWDADMGGTFPLMDAKTIARLHAEGVVFGSHLASHRAADGLSTRDLVGELLRSRSALRSWTGTVPTSLAPPYGATDQRVRYLAAECGYTACFSTRTGTASFGADVFDLPRIEVRGDWTMQRFAEVMEGCLQSQNS